ncbi:MAG: hypothetical protein JNK64_07600 [Myxococcales bacterium]|nr:hypothetical protein [Myxococcales bacterium]
MSGAFMLRDRGARHQMLAAEVAELVRRAPDVETGLRILAGYQAQLPTRGAWATKLAAPVFDEIPLAGVGLRRHELDGEVVWVGPVARVGRALGRARARGLVQQVDQANGGARVFRVGSAVLELVATLIVDAAAAAPPPIERHAPAIASQGPSALMLAVGCMAYGTTVAPTLGLALCGLALPLWILTEVRRNAQRRTSAATSPRRATLTLAGATASPYRGAAAEPVQVERFFAWFREAGVAIAARHGDAHVTADDGTECRIDGAGFGAVRIAELVVGYDDAAGPATVARVLATHVGPVQVALAHGGFTIADVAGFERWRAEHRRVRAALADLADALEVEVRNG